MKKLLALFGFHSETEILKAWSVVKELHAKEMLTAPPVDPRQTEIVKKAIIKENTSKLFSEFWLELTQSK